jgi:hypothetical protein
MSHVANDVFYGTGIFDADKRTCAIVSSNIVVLVKTKNYLEGRVSMSSISAAFDRQLEAFNVLDLESFVDAYDSNASISRDETLFLNGRDEIRSFYQDRFNNQSLHCEVLERVEFGQRWLVAHEKVGSATSVVEVVGVFEVQNDRIIRAHLLTKTP